MANTGFKGVDCRQTGSELVFRALLESSSGVIVTTGTTSLRVYELQSDGTLKSYDFSSNTFKTTTLTTETEAMSHQTGNNGATNTGIWTYSLATVSGFTVGAVYLMRVDNTGASPQTQYREFQYGSAEGDLITVANGTGVAELSTNPVMWNGTVFPTVATAGIPDVNVKNVNNVASTSVTTINAVLGTTANPSFSGTFANSNLSSINGISTSSVSTINAYIGTTVNPTYDANNYLKVDLVDIAGNAVGSTSAQLGVNVVTINGQTATAAAGVTFPSSIASPTNITAGTITTVTTVTNQLTAAAIATGIWQDTTSGDFTVASSIGKSLYTSGNVPGAASGLLIAGSNAATTFTTLTSTGAFTVNGVSNVSQTGDSYARIGSTGSGLTSLAAASTALSTAQWTNSLATNLGTLAGHDPGATLASQTNITGGTITTVTTVTGLSTSLTTINNNVLAIPTDPYTGTPPTAAAIATAIWQDATAGDFTAANSIGKSLYTGVAPGASGGLFIAGTNDHLTITNSTLFSGSISISQGLVISQSQSNIAGVSISGNGASPGIAITGGTTGAGITVAGGATSGLGILVSTVDGSAIQLSTMTGSGITINAGGSGHGIAISAQGNGMNILANDFGMSIVATNNAGVKILSFNSDGLVCNGVVDIACTGSQTIGANLAGSVVSVVDSVEVGSYASGQDPYTLVMKAQMTEGYAANGVAPTMEECAFMSLQAINEFNIVGTTLDVYKLDGMTVAMTITTNSATNPTSRVRTA